MVRSLKARLEKLEEYAGKTEYATTEEAEKALSEIKNTKELIIFWDNIGFCDD